MIAAAYYTCRYMIIWVNLTKNQKSFAQMCIKPKNKFKKNKKHADEHKCQNPESAIKA